MVSAGYRFRSVGPVVNLRGFGLSGVIDCGSFVLRVIESASDVTELINRGFCGEWYEAWFESFLDDENSKKKLNKDCSGRLFIETGLRSRKRESLTLNLHAPRPSIKGMQDIEDAANTKKGMLVAIEMGRAFDALRKKYPTLEVRRDLDLPHQGHPLFHELLTLNLFMRQPIFIREAFSEDTEPIRRSEEGFADLKHEEGGGEYWVEPEQRLTVAQIPPLKKWTAVAEELLTSSFLRDRPSLFGALEGLLEGDLAYRGAYGKRLKAYFVGLGCLFGSKGPNDSSMADCLVRRVSKLLQSFQVNTARSRDTLVKCSEIRNAMEHKIEKRIKYRLYEELDCNKRPGGMLQTVEQLRDLLRQTILCHLGFYSCRRWRWRSIDSFVLWLDHVDEAQLKVELRAVTSLVRGAISMGEN